MALLTFLVLNLNGTKTFMFHMTTSRFLSPKAKITKFGDKQASRLVSVQNTSLSDVLR